MIRAPKLPLLPGNSFPRNVGQTRFHRATIFEHLRGEIPYLSEIERPGPGGYPRSGQTVDRYPSIYPRKEYTELQGWLAFDKQVLSFDAYFQEAMWEVYGSPYQFRMVKIYFYLEDGTIQVVETKTDNSGMTQGTIIRRQRIKFPKPMDGSFYDIIDFNVGKEVELYGRVFKIINCDKFTRNFLNRMGIHVGDPINPPIDPYVVKKEKRKDDMLPKKPNRNIDTLGQFLQFDRHVLRFYAYWDDRGNPYGILHKFKIQYYLADDTMDIKEIVPPNAGMDSGFMFIRRQKIPKLFIDLPGPGHEVAFNNLNVLPTGFLKGKSIFDAINVGYEPVNFYRENDLVIGACLNIYGRKFVITDCDPYTKEHYRKKFGMDDFRPMIAPKDDDVGVTDRELPPWNGYGSFEDSEVNCRHFVLTPPKKDIYKLLTKGRVGLDQHILRFRARMISHDPNFHDRKFIVAHNLKDDTTSIFEVGVTNSGFITGMFISTREIFKPGQEMFVPKKPDIYTKSDFWVGCIMVAECFKFEITFADEYTLRYMELHCEEFPKSNIKLIVDKIKEKLRPQYKEFVCQYFRPCVDNVTPGFTSACSNVLSYQQLKTALKALLGDDITEHEIITVARFYRMPPKVKFFNRDEIKNVILSECRRFMFRGIDRLLENFRAMDPCCRGYVGQQKSRNLLVGAKVPVDVDVIEALLEQVKRNECGEVSVQDLFSFFDYRGFNVKAFEPINFRREFSEFKRMLIPMDYTQVDCECLLKNISPEEGMNLGGEEEAQKGTK